MSASREERERERERKAVEEERTTEEQGNDSALYAISGLRRNDSRGRGGNGSG